MRACVVDGEAVQIEERPDPVPGQGELLVRVKAAGINGADVLQMRGRYPAPPGSPVDIPGLEFAGEVVGTGPGADRFSVGQRVMGVVGGGGQAELITAHERTVMPVPDHLDWPEAGGFPETYSTAYDALFTQAGLAAGERLLVNGGAGGVGTAAIQLAGVSGAHTVVTTRHPDLAERITALGRNVVVSEDPLQEEPFDVVLELVGAPNLAADLKTLAARGRLCFIGVGAGARGELNVLHLMNKMARIHGSTLRSRPLEEKSAVARLVEKHVLPHLGTGAIRVQVDSVFPLEKAKEAYEHFARGGKLGKIVLTV